MAIVTARQWLSENLKCALETKKMFDAHQKRFVKIVHEMSHRHSNALLDWAEITAITLANSLQFKDKPWQEREDRYLEIINRYSKEEHSLLAEMLACVVNSLSCTSPHIHSDKECRGDCFNFHDTLGEIYMTDEIAGRSRMDKDVAFTPWNVAEMMAEIALGDNPIHHRGFITLAEPACGTGVMGIAAAAVLKNHDVNFQKCMHITATDVRSIFAHMAYIQFSLLHIPAVVIHGNTLSGEVWSTWETPAHQLGLWTLKLNRLYSEQKPETLKEYFSEQPKIPNTATIVKVPTQSAFDFELHGGGNANPYGGQEQQSHGSLRSIGQKIDIQHKRNHLQALSRGPQKRGTKGSRTNQASQKNPRQRKARG